MRATSLVTWFYSGYLLVNCSPSLHQKLCYTTLLKLFSYSLSLPTVFGHVGHPMYENDSGNTELKKTMVHIPPHSLLVSTCISVVFRNVAQDAVSRSEFRNTVLRIDLLIRQVLKRTVQQKLLFLKIQLEMKLLTQINVNVCSKLLEILYNRHIKTTGAWLSSYDIHIVHFCLPWVRRKYAPQSFATRFF